jgi:hypothetical protein
MADMRNKQSACWENTESYQFECELNAALAKYSAVEPRTGLEERILANVRAERAQTSNRSWWTWGFAAALATVIVVAAFVWRSGKPSPVITTKHPPTPAHRVDKPAANVVVSHHASHEGTLRGSNHVQITAGRDAHSNSARQTQPRLDRFPSRRPLSEQEQLLKSYVAAYPERAVLLARLRTEELRQDQVEEMKSFLSDNRGMDSEGNYDTTGR